jgi:hypothetical protein
VSDDDAGDEISPAADSADPDEEPIQWTDSEDEDATDESSTDGEPTDPETEFTDAVGNNGAEPTEPDKTQPLEDTQRPREDDDPEATGEPMTTPSVEDPLRIGPDDEITDNTIGWPIQFEQPNISRETFPTWKLRKQLKKRQKLLDEGYVEWYLIDDAFPRPTYVQPTNRDGVPEVRHDGDRYLFPRAAALPNKATGMWTFVHRRGFSDPLNLRDADEHAIPADVLDEYLSMSVSSSPPSLFDKFDVDGQTLLYAGLALVLVLGAAYQVMGGA